MCHRGSPCFPAVIIETPVHAFAASSPNRVGRAAASYSEFFWETVLWVSDANGRARRLSRPFPDNPRPGTGAGGESGHGEPADPFPAGPLRSQLPSGPAGETRDPRLIVIDEWFVEGFGCVTCEPGGLLNLNRFLPVTLTQARLVRRLVAERETRLELSFGFSDVLTLSLDDQVLYRGENLFAPAVQNQGYVSLDHTVACTLAPGEHVLAAELARTEFFGWGLIVVLRGDGVGLEPAAIG